MSKCDYCDKEIGKTDKGKSRCSHFKNREYDAYFCGKCYTLLHGTDVDGFITSHGNAASVNMLNLVKLRLLGFGNYDIKIRDDLVE